MSASFPWRPTSGPGTAATVFSVADELEKLARALPTQPARRPLTTKQRRLLDYLRTYISEHGHAPTFDVVADAFGYRSISTVHEHLQNLESAGYVRREYNRPQSLTLTDDHA